MRLVLLVRIGHLDSLLHGNCCSLEVLDLCEALNEFPDHHLSIILINNFLMRYIGIYYTTDGKRQLSRFWPEKSNGNRLPAETA
jgi:hypothetical protein